MSFDFGPIRNLSNVQASSKTTEGGGGNTGYFKREKQEEEEAKLGFAKDYPEDSFTKEEKEDDSEQSLLEILKNLLNSFLDLIKSLFSK